MTPSSDVRAILFGDKEAPCSFFEATVAPDGLIYQDDPALGGTAVECLALRHVGTLDEGDRVLVLSATNGKCYVIGKI